VRIASLLLPACLATAAVAAPVDLKAPVRVVEPFTSSVSLDAPGALAALKASNPDHYRRAVGILRVASDMPCEGLPRVIQADFEAALSQCEGALLKTSWSAQRDVAFVLDGTRYTKRVRLNEREAFVPLDDRRR